MYRSCFSAAAAAAAASAAAASAAAAALCVAILLLLRCSLLLAAGVRHRVPDDKICSRGSLYLIPEFSFSSFKHDFFHCPLGSTVAFSAAIFYL